jgi:hypothetical protein
MQAMSDASSNPLHRLLGDWCGKETIQPSQWGAGGPTQARVACRGALGGKAFVQDYQAERDGKTWLQAHAVYIRQANEPDYALFWFDSLGFMPREPARGTWDGHTLTFIRTSPRGQSRHAYTFLNDDTYQMTLESSFDGGATYILVMQGVYQRTHGEQPGREPASMSRA